MRKINRIISHCADTRLDQDFSVEDVRAWHKARGWRDIGYHYYIKLDGSLHEGRDLEQAGAHCSGHNSDSIGICFEGGKDEQGQKWDKPMEAQIKTGKELINRLREYYGELSLHGHYEYSSKSCPNFDVCILEEM